jgi:hypothetical protein
LVVKNPAFAIFRRAASFGKWADQEKLPPRSKHAATRGGWAVARTEPTLLAVFDREDYERLCDTRELEGWIDRFWKLMTVKEPESKEDLREVFAQYDSDGGGSLCRAELVQVLDSLGKPHHPAAMDALMSELDADGAHARASCACLPACRPACSERIRPCGL